eukprot:m.1607 g.1607  ORF g.1607 m.1607 type:complete len:85 (-) comp1029_c0_seq1:88-342(-)
MSSSESRVTPIPVSTSSARSRPTIVGDLDRDPESARVILDMHNFAQKVLGVFLDKHTLRRLVLQAAQREQLHLFGAAFTKVKSV